MSRAWLKAYCMKHTCLTEALDLYEEAGGLMIRAFMRLLTRNAQRVCLGRDPLRDRQHYSDQGLSKKTSVCDKTDPTLDSK